MVQFLAVLILWYKSNWLHSWDFHVSEVSCVWEALVWKDKLYSVLDKYALHSIFQGFIVFHSKCQVEYHLPNCSLRHLGWSLSTSTGYMRALSILSWWPSQQKLCVILLKICDYELLLYFLKLVFLPKWACVALLWRLNDLLLLQSRDAR